MLTETYWRQPFLSVTNIFGTWLRSCPCCLMQPYAATQLLRLAPSNLRHCSSCWSIATPASTCTCPQDGLMYVPRYGAVGELGPYILINFHSPTADRNTGQKILGVFSEKPALSITS